MATVIELAKQDELKSRLNTTAVCVLNFWAPWAAPCKQIKDVIIELVKDPCLSSGVHFVNIEAEKFPELCQANNIIAVPTCILIKRGKELDRINGVYPAELAKKVKQHSANTSMSESLTKPPSQEELNSRLEKLVKSSPVMLFMKGTPDNVRCGFSKKMIEILNSQNVRFGSFDILSDDGVRQGLKEYSKWPTFPQLYVKGELLGGLDIVNEMIDNGEFVSSFPPEAIIPPLEDRLKQLINMEEMMIFMKGIPSEPRCKFSRELVSILNESNVSFGHFNILADDEVRQGLKQFSNWPTYPQVYVKGELIGGLDIIKELKESGELKETIEGADSK